MKNKIIEELKKTPIKSVFLFLERYPDYAKQRSFYQREIIAKTKVNTNNFLFDEKLDDCYNYDIKRKNYYYHSEVLKKNKESEKYLSEEVLLRKSVLLDLKKIDNFINQFGLRLFIMSGYRHPDLQNLLLQEADRQKGAIFANKMLANPSFHAPHSTGAAFDIELWDEKNDKLLKTKSDKGFDLLSLELSRQLSLEDEEVRDNRRLIHNLLSTNYLLSKENVFIHHPFEYWHYGRHEKLSSFFSCNDSYQVYYEMINHKPYSCI